MRLRVGLGFDIHRLEAGRPLILGGVRIPHPAGLLGHSDGDVLFHAIVEALLGAAGLGNIGEMFPDTDPRYKAYDSAEFLRSVADRVRAERLQIGNVDSNILAESPRLLTWFPAMKANVAGALGIPSEDVSVKARTMEGLGSIGRGEAIAAEAVALVYAP